MDENERRIRLRLKNDFVHYASKCLKIRTKSGAIYNFTLNRAQAYIHERVEQQLRATGKVRVILLKGRQQGASTYIEGRFYWRVTHRFGVRAFILTHEIDATNNLFEMAQRYHENCPPVVRPSIEASNAKELIFAGLDSGYKLGTANNKSVGRSSTIQLMHGSEVAFWTHAHEHAKGIMNAVPPQAGTEIFIESTANGLGNYFHQQWQLAESGESEFIPIFVPWFWQEEYQREVGPDFIRTPEEDNLAALYDLTDEQLLWRRFKITDLSVSGSDGHRAFMQEYPCNAIEAFQTTGEDSFILPDEVMRARKGEAEAYGPLVIGVDPARFGDDRTSIVYRRGRVAYNLQSYKKKDNMQITGIIHNLILQDAPTKVCIDMGGGAGIYDRLKELGHAEVIVPINFGGHALNHKRFKNKRAEMWGLMKDWLMDTPVQIPDNDTLHADLCGPRYRILSNSELLIEAKEDMKKRGIRSPDEGDALALTFACPATALQQTRKHEYAMVAKDLMNTARTVDRLKKSAYV